jgi:hypothetical protein
VQPCRQQPENNFDQLLTTEVNSGTEVSREMQIEAENQSAAEQPGGRCRLQAFSVEDGVANQT